MPYAGSAIANEYWAGIDGDQDSRSIRFLVTNAVSDNDALDLLEDEVAGGAPFFYDNMPRENIRIRELSKKDGIYEGVAIYTRRSGEKSAPETNAVAVNVTGASAGTEEDPDKELFSFNVSVESQIETHPTDVSGQLIASDVGNAGPGGIYELLPFNGYNYDKSYGFRGAGFLRPTASFSLDIYPEDSKVNRTFQNLVMSTVGKVNNATFRKWSAGEVMLTSATGESRNGADWRFSYQFAVKETRTGVDLGNGVTFASVEGWDHIDPYYVERTTDLGGGDKWTLHLCRQARIWRPYTRADFAGLFV